MDKIIRTNSPSIFIRILFLKVFRREKGHGVQKEEKKIGKGKETKSLKVFIRLSNALFLKH